MERISFSENYLEHFKVIHSPTLFDLPLDLLKQKRCPVCFNKLKDVRSNPTIMICRNKKHLKPFVIKKTTLSKFIKK